MARNTRQTSSAAENVGSCRARSKHHVVGCTLGRGWAATCAFQNLEHLRTSTKGTFSELLEIIEGNHTRCFTSTFSSCALWGGNSPDNHDQRVFKSIAAYSIEELNVIDYRQSKELQQGP